MVITLHHHAGCVGTEKEEDLWLQTVLLHQACDGCTIDLCHPLSPAHTHEAHADWDWSQHWIHAQSHILSACKFLYDTSCAIETMQNWSAALKQPTKIDCLQVSWWDWHLEWQLRKCIDGCSNSKHDRHKTELDCLAVSRIPWERALSGSGKLTVCATKPAVIQILTWWYRSSCSDNMSAPPLW